VPQFAVGMMPSRKWGLYCRADRSSDGAVYASCGGLCLPESGHGNKRTGTGDRSWLGIQGVQAMVHGPRRMGSCGGRTTAPPDAGIKPLWANSAEMRQVVTLIGRRR